MQYLLSQLAELNIKVKVVEEQLHVSAPAGTMTNELGALLRQHKKGIVELIRDNKSTARYEPLPTLIPNPAQRYDEFPLTAIQHAYWMGRSQKKIELGGVSTHLYFESDAAELDIEQLERVFNVLIKRHDMLRATISGDGVQRVVPEIARYKIQVNDVAALPETDKQTEILQVRNRMSHQVLPTDKAPIMEIYATRISDSLVRLHISLDMLVLDAWSMMLLFKELHTLYLNPATILPTLSISYRDYALAEEQLIETDAYQEARDYWWNIMDSLPAAPQIPLRNDGVSGVPPTFTRRRFCMPAKRWQLLQEKAKQVGVTPTGIVLAAFTEVLTLWSSSAHYTLNVTLFNRQPLHADVNKLLGDFTSLMLLEVDHRDTASFKSRAVATQLRFMRDLQHRAISGLEVMRELRRRRSAMMEAAMPVVFTGGLVYSGDGNDAGLLESFGPMVYGVSQTPQVSLDHQVMEVNGDLVCNWDCVDEKFAPGLIDDLYQNFCELIDQLVDDDALWDEKFVTHLPENQAQIRQEVNDTTVENSCQEMLHSLFIKQALQNPEAIAIITHEGLEISYGLLLAMANSLAETLVQKGVVTEQCVAIVMHKGWEQVVAVLAVLIAGGAYLPINAGLPEKRRTLLLDQGNVSIVLTQQKLENLLLWPDSVDCISVELVASLQYLTQAPEQRQHNSNLAYVLFTSGTTGVPKGVMIEHRNAVNTVYYVNEVLGVTAEDRVLAVSALNFDLSVYDLFGTLCAGGALVMPDPEKITDPNHWLQLIREHAVTLWNSAPALMGMLVDHMEDIADNLESVVLHIPDSLRMVWMSGDRIPVPLPDRIRQCFPHARVIALGGPTETSIWSIYYPVDAVAADWKSIPYGKPLPNQSIHVLNDRLQSCPEGVAGTIYVGGRGLARGYLGDAEKTQKQFIVHPETGERLYDSGDLGRYLSDGNVEILGRSDFQIKIRGYRIELGEIASTLTQHAEIKHAVAMPVLLADGQQQIAVYIVPESNLSEFSNRQGAAITPQSLVESIDDCVAALVLSTVDETYRNALTCVKTAYLQSIFLAFTELGLATSTGNTLSLDDCVKAGVKDEFLPWCSRAMEYLVAEAYGHFIGDSNISIDVELVCKDKVCITENTIVAFQKMGYSQQELALIERNINEITDILQGKVDLEDLYYSGDDTAIFNRKYLADAHAQIESVILMMAKDIGQEFSVLEVGAGLGSVTQGLAEILENNAKSYLITDVSEASLEFLYEKLANKQENLEFGLFDLDQAAEEQGLYQQHYHVIVASMVLHEVDDIPQTISELRALLKPDGLLLLVEPQCFNPTFDLHLGLQTGFNNRSDYDKRFLTSNQWSELLLTVGFTEALTLDNTGSALDSECLSVIVARAGEVASIDTDAVRSYMSELLPDYMVPQYLMPIEKLPVSANGKIDYKALPSVRAANDNKKSQTISPRNNVEQCIFDGWMTVLHTPDVCVTSDFFDIGGDSLLAAKAVREINQRLPEFRLEVFEFFEHLTIELLEKLFNERGSCNTAGLRKVEDVATSLKFNTEEIVNDVQAILDEIGLIENIRSNARISINRSFLLTGATGWLGAYLLEELLNNTSAEIICLGRAIDERDLLTRILANIDRYEIEISQEQKNRIKPMLGDLEKPDLGLQGESWSYVVNNIEAIYHAAASVGIASSYADMRKTNLGSIVGLAKLAIEAEAKPIFFCSSVAVLIQYDGDGFLIHKEESAVPTPDGLIVGYAQSKWAAESVLLALADRGLPVKIYRIAHVLPATKTKIAKENYIFESVLAVSRLAGAIPDWKQGKFYGVPVDIVSRLLVQSSLLEDNYRGVIHMDNHDPSDFTSLINLMLEIQVGQEASDFPLVSFEDWLTRCRQVKDQLPIEKQAVLNFLLEPTQAGTMLEALYQTEPSYMTYMDALSGTGTSPLSQLTPPEYWDGYFKTTEFL